MFVCGVDMGMRVNVLFWGEGRRGESEFEEKDLGFASVLMSTVLNQTGRLPLFLASISCHKHVVAAGIRHAACCSEQ